MLPLVSSSASGVENPLSAFGELLTAEPSPRIQLDAIYGIRSNCETFQAGTGSVSSDMTAFVCATGAGVGGYGVIRSRRTIRSRPGQGSLFRFTALFDKANATALSLQAAGPFNATNAILVGYNGTKFGIMHRTDGRHETRTLTITTPAGGGENVSLTLNGVLYTIPVTSGTEAFNAYEIEAWLNANQSVWDAHQNGDTVVLFSRNPGAMSGSYSVASSGALVGNIVQDGAGVANTEEWVYQTPGVGEEQFNGDTLDGSGESGMTIDTGKMNLFVVSIGYGGVVIYIENPETRKFIAVHTFRFPNNTIIPFFLNPSFKIGWVAASLGSTTNLTVKGVNCMGEIEGRTYPLNREKSHTNQKNVSSTLVSVLAIRVRDVYHDVVQLSEVIPKSVSVAVEGTKSAEILVLLNPTFSSTPNWFYKDVNESIVELDTSAGTMSSEGEEIDSDTVAGGSDDRFALDAVHLERDDILVVAAKIQGGSGNNVTAGITWIEE